MSKTWYTSRRLTYWPTDLSRHVVLQRHHRLAVRNNQWRVTRPGLRVRLVCWRTVWPWPWQRNVHLWPYRGQTSNVRGLCASEWSRSNKPFQRDTNLPIVSYKELELFKTGSTYRVWIFIFSTASWSLKPLLQIAINVFFPLSLLL